LLNFFKKKVNILNVTIENNDIYFTTFVEKKNFITITHHKHIELKELEIVNINIFNYHKLGLLFKKVIYEFNLKRPLIYININSSNVTYTTSLQFKIFAYKNNLNITKFNTINSSLFNLIQFYDPTLLINNDQASNSKIVSDCYNNFIDNKIIDKYISFNASLNIDFNLEKKYIFKNLGLYL